MKWQRSSSFFQVGGGGGGVSCRPFDGSPRRRASSGPLAHTFTRLHVELFYNVLSRFEVFYFFKLNKFSSKITKLACKQTLLLKMARSKYR